MKSDYNILKGGNLQTLLENELVFNNSSSHGCVGR